MKYLFKNAYFPFTDQLKDLYVENGLIKEIKQGIELNEKDVRPVDLEGRILIKGFVDSHMHLDKALIGDKIANQTGTLGEAIRIMTKYKAQMTKEDVKERAKKVIEMAFDNGSRFLRTHVDVDENIGLKSLEALIELREEYKDRLLIQIVAFPQDGIVKSQENYEYLEEALKLGADLVGGIPATEDDPIKHMEMIFDLAIKYDVDVDMHIDETDDPTSLTLKDLAEMTIANGYKGRVTAGHCCSLSANTREAIAPVIELVKKAGISIITLPSTNLYLQGRGDSYNVRRGIAPVKFLLENNIPVLIGSDNIRDPFNPFGNGDLLEELLVSAHGVHMGGEEDLNKLFDMVSIIPAQALGLDYEIGENDEASFVVIDAKTKASAIIGQANVFGSFIGMEFTINKETKEA